MQIDDYFPGCCKAAVLWGFGENDHGNAPATPPTEAQITNKKREIAKCIDNFVGSDDDEDDGYYFAVIYANTTEGQAATNEALSQLGFYTIDKPAENSTGRKIFPWILPLNEWRNT